MLITEHQWDIAGIQTPVCTFSGIIHVLNRCPYVSKTQNCSARSGPCPYSPFGQTPWFVLPQSGKSGVIGMVVGQHHELIQRSAVAIPIISPFV